MVAWVWIKEHAVVVGVGVVAVLAFILGGFLFGAKRPDKAVKRELDAIDAGQKAATTALNEGADVAVVALERQHRETLTALTDAQRAKTAELKKDPRALAKYLTKLSNP